MNQFKAEVLQSIVASGEAWVTPNRISELTQCPPDVVQDCLADLETDGMVAAWESDEGLFITLTPIAAERLEVHIVNVNDSTYRWAPLDEDGPAQKVQRETETETDVDADTLESVGAISAAKMSLDTEKVGRDREWCGVQRFDEFALPYPTVLLGGGMALWDNIRHVVCPACGNRELEDYEFCLLCDRWGLDHLLHKREPKVQIKTFQETEVRMSDGIKVK